jgi:hypothetical protein
MTHEALSILHALGEQLRARLAELPEYRALMVIDRTILDLAQILNEPIMALPACAAPPARLTESPVGYCAAIAGAPRRVETAPAAAAGSQGRMATAIAETIAARTASLNAPAATASPISQTVSAAS